MDTTNPDPLLLLRQSIASGSSIVPTTSASADASTPEANLSQATHLLFTHPNRVAIPIDTPTRFVSNDKPVDLRSIYFTWLNREVAIPDYNASATQLNEELGGAGSVHKFAFVERLDLITWLEGASEESEYIKPLAGDKDDAAVSAAAVGGTATGTATSNTATSSAQAKSGRGTLDPRYAQIYNSERKMGDRNSVLRGIKPTDFSHIRKLAVQFLAKKPSPSAGLAQDPRTLAINPKATRRPDPIILLSPSASSILRMSNIKPFLENGRYQPPDHSVSANMLNVSRVMKEIDPSRPMRFILVEGPEQFKPEYWNQVVAVFTTGQSWQFKNYKWSTSSELFKHVLGIYVGWRGEQPPESIRGFGHRVLATSVDKYMEGQTNRWRDREVVEQIWKTIEANMRAKGWKRDAAPTNI